MAQADALEDILEGLSETERLSFASMVDDTYRKSKELDSYRAMMDEEEWNKEFAKIDQLFNESLLNLNLKQIIETYQRFAAAFHEYGGKMREELRKIGYANPTIEMPPLLEELKERCITSQKANDRTNPLLQNGNVPHYSA